MSEPEPIPSRLEGVQVKIDRSRKHLRDLEMEIAYFLYLKPYEFVSKFDPDRSAVSAYFVLTTPEPGLLPYWGGVIGDVVHNLRSALDHLAWQIVDANGGATGNDIKFPSSRTEHEYEEWRRPRPDRKKRDPFVGVDCRAIKAIEEEQPYKRKNGQDPATHPLAVLNALWNRDKHKVLIPAIFQFPGLVAPRAPFAVTFTNPMMCWCEDFELDDTGDKPPGLLDPMLQIGRLEDGQCMVDFVGRATGPNPKVNVQGDLSFQVCLDSGEPAAGALIGLHNHVNEVIARLSVFL